MFFNKNVTIVKPCVQGYPFSNPIKDQRSHVTAHSSTKSAAETDQDSR